MHASLLCRHLRQQQHATHTQLQPSTGMQAANTRRVGYKYRKVFQVVIGLNNGAVVFISPRNNDDNRRRPKEL